MFNQRSTVSGNSFLKSVYPWMACGLAITAGVAYYVASTPALVNYIYSSRFMAFGLMIAQLLLVLTLSIGINKLSFPAAAGIFLGYSALTGLTLSAIFLVFSLPSIAISLVVAASMFLAMALYGYFTDADLSSMGSFLLMGLIGLIIAGLVNMFFQSSAFEYVISGIGVIVFALLTAYDVQKLKVMSYQLSGEVKSKFSIIGALTLYLDFINLFLYLLRFMGQKRND